MLDLNLYLKQSLDYESYFTYIQDLVEKNDLSTPYLDYTRLNMQRMIRLNKTIQLLPSLESVVKNISSKQCWLILSEAWCGDAAQTTPLFNKIAILNKNIELRFLWRDQNLDLMDQFLTDGKSRSIPKLIVTDELGNVLMDWGPRPQELQRIYKQLNAEKVPFNEVAEKLHHWYALDKTISAQKEIQLLLEKL